MTSPAEHGPLHEAGPADAPDATIFDMLDLEPIEQDLYRANFVFDDPASLYGGQVAAQALRAAGATVEPGRLPHSLHGYFLRPGDALRPTVFQVYRDRDGRSFSARRVVALQRGKVIFNMSASFHVAEDGPDEQHEPMPDVAPPDLCEPWTPVRLFSHVGAVPRQPYPDLWLPSRFWTRCTETSSDPMLAACALTYLSDVSEGLGRFNTPDRAFSSSLDHAVWFHRPTTMGAWLLNDMHPHIVSGGRGWYTGSIYDESGALLASLAQEGLFRKLPRDHWGTTQPRLESE